MEDDNKISRRKAVVGLGASLAALAVLSTPGQPARLASIYVQFAASDATGQIYGASGGAGQQ